MSCVILAELLHSPPSPSSTKTNIWGRCTTFKKTSPPHLAFSHAISSQEMTLGKLVWGLRTLGDLPSPPKSKQNNLRFLHKQKQNMKGFLQNPLLMSWLSRHLSGPMRMDIPDMLREAWKSHTHTVIAILLLSMLLLYESLSLHWLLMAEMATRVIITAQMAIPVSGGAFPESGAFFSFGFLSDLKELFLCFSFHLYEMKFFLFCQKGNCPSAVFIWCSICMCIR